MTDMLQTAGTVDGQAAGPRLTEEAVAWMLEKRAISLETLVSLGVGSSTAFFGDAGKSLPAIYFKYGEHWKARSFPDKHFTASKKQAYQQTGRYRFQAEPSSNHRTIR